MDIDIQEAVRTELNRRYLPSDFLGTEVVVLLGARLVFDYHTGLWRSTRLNERLDELPDLKDEQARKRTPPLSCLRVEAAMRLVEQRPQVVVIVSGRSSNPQERPSSAEVMAAELGPLPNSIILDKDAANTWDHLAHLSTYCPPGLRNLVMITNAYHVPRTMAMLEQTKGAIRSGLQIEVMAAEAILKSFDRSYIPVIDEAYATDPFVRTFIESERLGMEHLRAGTYQFT